MTDLGGDLVETSGQDLRLLMDAWGDEPAKVNMSYLLTLRPLGVPFCFIVTGEQCLYLHLTDNPQRTAY